MINLSQSYQAYTLIFLLFIPFLGLERLSNFPDNLSGFSEYLLDMG
jgi:hypothetical protein